MDALPRVPGNALFYTRGGQQSVHCPEAIHVGHNHMLDDEPRMILMHFWGYGDAVDLTKGLKAALERIGA